MSNKRKAVKGQDLANETQHAGMVPTDDGARYAIRVKGQLDRRWEEWFDGLAIAIEPGGETVLSGPIVDQSALHGVLDRLQRLGLELLAVHRIKPT
jgi:hypothetical protein